MMKKRIWIFCILSLCLSVCFCFLWKSGESGYDRTAPEVQNTKSTDNAMGEAKEEKEKYYMHIEGDTICAYTVQGNEKTLIKQTPVSPVTLPEGELQMLRDGIYAGSYEELCLYLEAYIS